MKKVKIVLVNTLTDDYEKTFYLKVNSNSFLEVEEEFQEFVEAELCQDEYGIYEYDGLDLDTAEVILSIDIEEEEGFTSADDIRLVYQTVEDKLETYLEEANLIEDESDLVVLINFLNRQ